MTTPALRLVSDVPPPDDNDPEHMEEWELFGHAAGWTAATFKTRRGGLDLLRRFAGVPLPAVTANQLATWIVSYASASSATRSTYYRSARSYYSWLRKVGYRADDPTEAVPRPKDRRKAPRPVTTAALGEALLRCRHRKTYAYIVLAAYAGLRVHEIAKLRSEDIDVDAGTLYVVGKGGVEGVIPLHPRIAKLTRGFPERGYWFPGGRDNAHVNGKSVGSAVLAAFAAVGVTMTCHQLRHWYGTYCLRSSGGNLRVAQELLRHSSPGTTAIYTLIEDKERRAAIMGLPEPVHDNPEAWWATPLVVPHELLTDREAEVLGMIAGGLEVAAMAERMGLSPSTVRQHIGNLYSKLHTSTRGGLVFKAVQAGLLSPSSVGGGES